MIEKGKHWISFVSVRSDKVKNERRSFPYDPDRTKTDDDLQAEKIYKKVICQNETNFIGKHRSQATSTLEIVLNYL